MAGLAASPPLDGLAGLHGEHVYAAAAGHEHRLRDPLDLEGTATMAESAVKTGSSAGVADAHDD